MGTSRVLTVILFDLQINLAGAPCPIYPVLPIGIAGPEPDPHHQAPLPVCHQTEKTLKKKYVDDLSLLKTIDLKTALVPSTPILGPPNLHEIPGLTLISLSYNISWMTCMSSQKHPQDENKLKENKDFTSQLLQEV